MSNKAAQQRKNKGRRPNGKMSWAQAVRDMVVSSINKGQLPLFGIFFVFCLLILKMPAEDVSALVFELAKALNEGESIAYILLCITLVAWYAHAKFMRKAFSDEAARIGNEKSDLQSKMAGVKFGSSDKK